ncbi:MAG: glucose-6-phosphate dehydrogenase [Chromatiaceae bacterium]|nr:glucose-6-phosphate dehydrogenase [Chromatiaceae bacterium]
MNTAQPTALPKAAQFVLFGAMGDLAWRLVGPALFNLYLDGQLPAELRLVGVDREISTPALLERLREGVQRFSRRGSPTAEQWSGFSARVATLPMDLQDNAAYSELAEMLRTSRATPVTRIYYLAIPPSLFEAVASGLAHADLHLDEAHTRIVVEKPLGRDLDSFRAIDNTLRQHFAERQIYRMDHFLGKETVQNILAMRFANPIFEPVWNRRYIDHVTITVAETIGVAHRAGYYEHAGALRDMVQNHLMQLMCLIAMEPPVAYDADDIRNKKLDVLLACRPIRPDDVSAVAVRGQYAGGWIQSVEAQGYRDESGVAPDSNSETYAAVKLLVDNWRWQDVPFYLRTGKRLGAAVSEISIRFRDVPHNAFPVNTGFNAQPVRLVIQIQPQEGIILKFMAKEPGSPLRLSPVDMRFAYGEAFSKPSPAAYETLLHDLLQGDATLFMRSDQVQAAWKLLMPIIQTWEGNPAPDFPNYPAGSWGPEAAERLVARDGRAWLTPSQWHPKTRAGLPGANEQ